MKVQIGEAFYFIQNGANIKQGVVDGGIPITRIETISNNQFNRDRMGYAGITDVQKYSPYILQDGDILMSHINSLAYLGRAVLYNKQNNETIIHGMNLLRLKANREIILPAYACYFFQTNAFKEQINRIAKKSVNQASFSVADLKRTVMSVVPLEEQNKIVSRLDKINSLISLRKKQLQKLDDLVKSRFVEMFGDPNTNPMGWTEYPLSEMLNILGGYAFRSEGFCEADGIPVLRIGNINAGFFKPVNMVFWEEDESLERYIMYPGDLVMSLTGTVGKDDYGNVCMLGNDYDKYYLNQRNAKLELKEGLDKHYLSQLLRFEKIKKRLTGISRGVRQANISNKDILGLRVPIPPIALQWQYAAFDTQVDKSKLTVQQGLDKLELLKQSLMQKYFG